MLAKKKPPATAKLFMHGRSQAVKLPKDYRFEGKEVRVRRDGESLVLEPIKKSAINPDELWKKLDAIGGRNYLKSGVGKLRATKRDPRKFFDK